MAQHLAAFIGLSTLLAIAPGPDLALVTRNALSHGTRGVLLTTSGLASALIVWLGAVAAGIIALVQTAPGVYSVLRVMGGLYLGYLGGRTLWGSLHEPPALTTDPPSGSGRSLWGQGFLSALLNPKLGVFFVTFFPQFVDPSHPVAPQVLALGAIFIAIGIGWMNIYGLSVSRLRSVILSARVRQWMERATGAVLLGFGVLLIVSRG